MQEMGNFLLYREPLPAMRNDGFFLTLFQEFMCACLPILQLFPVYPATQLQLKSFTASLQRPPFSHGPSAQSSISLERKVIIFK